MQKLISFYGRDPDDVNKLLEKGWTVVDFKTTAAEGSTLTTVLLEEPADAVSKRQKAKLEETLGKEKADELQKNLQNLFGNLTGALSKYTSELAEELKQDA